MSNTRLTVVVRKDLDMPAGLLAAQVAHMSDACMREAIVNRKEDIASVYELFTEEEREWMGLPYLSVLAVNCYEDLNEIYEHVQREKLPYNRWTDTIPSPTFPEKAINAFVGLSIGPADFDAIKMVTNGLELF